MSLSLSLILQTIKLFEFIVDFELPFSTWLLLLYDGVGDVVNDVVGSYLLLRVVVVETVLVRSLKTFKSIFSLAHSCVDSWWFFPLRWDPLSCHTFSSPVACGPCLTNCNRTGWINFKNLLKSIYQNYKTYHVIVFLWGKYLCWVLLNFRLDFHA
jgi:hypothetical protein